MAKIETVQQYLSGLDEPAGERVRAVLDRAVALVPEPELVISYQMPTLTSGGRRVMHVAGWASHLALYPEPLPTPQDPGLVEGLAPYASGKGTLRFPYADPLPIALIDRVITALYDQRA